jgi:hypothetical protein
MGRDGFDVHSLLLFCSYALLLSWERMGFKSGESCETQLSGGAVPSSVLNKNELPMSLALLEYVFRLGIYIRKKKSARPREQETQAKPADVAISVVLCHAKEILLADGRGRDRFCAPSGAPTEWIFTRTFTEGQGASEPEG